MKFYEQLGEDFSANSNALQPLLGNEYDDIKYLVTNPNISTPASPRDKKMANNLLNEIAGDGPNDQYFLDCGMAHSRPHEKNTLANILWNSEQLKGKIAVVALYCQDCTTAVEKVSNWAYPAIKGDVLKSFEAAAETDGIVIYDLSALPDNYSVIKAYCDLMVFARNQN